MKKTVRIISTVILSILLIFVFSTTAYAFTLDVSFSGPSSVDEGTEGSVNFTVAGDGIMTANLTVSVSGGGSFVSVSCDEGVTVSNDHILLTGFENKASFSGTIHFSVTSADNVVVTILGDCSGRNDKEKVDLGTGRSTSIAVRSVGQQQADKEAEEAARKAEEERLEKERIEREASEAASRATEESIRAEQESLAAIEASKQAIINASVSESAALESSKKQAEYESSSKQQAIDDSLSESQSLVDLTKAFAINGDYFIPYFLEEEDAERKFLFAVSDSQMQAPESYIKSLLVINTQDAWAFQTEDMDPDVYLVYGSFSEEEEPDFYFYVLTSDTFFSYKYIHSGGVHQVSTETAMTTTTESVTTSSEKATTNNLRVTYTNLAILSVCSLLLGAALTVLVMLIKKQRARKGVGPVSAKRHTRELNKDSATESTEEPDGKSQQESVEEVEDVNDLFGKSQEIEEEINIDEEEAEKAFSETSKATSETNKNNK